MYTKNIIVVCVQALLIQFVLTQCSCRPAVSANRPSHSKARGSLGLGLGCTRKITPCDGIHSSIFSEIDISPTTSGRLVVTSASPVAPTGIAVISDNAYEGDLAVAGEVPFVGTTAVEGLISGVGVGVVNNACGDDVTVMVSETTDLSNIAETAESTTIVSAKGFKPTTPIAPSNGLGLGNRLGCGNRG